jgi:hypothetical protein
MKAIFIFALTIISIHNSYAQNVLNARAFFETNKANNPGLQSSKDTVITVVDDNSNEVVSFSKVKLKADGKPVTDKDILPEGGIYRKKGKDYYKMNFIDVNVKKLGAKGDDVTDDTKIFQQAVEYLSATGGRLFIPSGFYRISGIAINGLKRINIQGEGENATFLRKTTTSNNAVISFSSASNELEFQCELSDLTVEGNSKVIGLDLLNFARFSLTNIRIRNCTTGINGKEF